MLGTLDGTQIGVLNGSLQVDTLRPEGTASQNLNLLSTSPARLIACAHKLSLGH